MLEPIENQYFLIGRVARSHGVDGTIAIAPEYNIPTLFDDIDLVRLQNTRGDLIPARIVSVRAQQKNNRLTFFVKFEHITDRKHAEAVKACRLYVAKDKLAHLIEHEAEASWLNFDVFDQAQNRIGTVEEVLDSAVHAILVVASDKKELLIPFVDEYVASVDEEQAVIYARNLDQLRGLQDD